jgi:hypothetical protein
MNKLREFGIGMLVGAVSLGVISIIVGTLMALLKLI